MRYRPQNEPTPVHMTPEDVACWRLGREIAKMAAHTLAAHRHNNPDDLAYCRRKFNFHTSSVEIFIVSSPKLADVFDRAAEVCFDVESKAVVEPAGSFAPEPNPEESNSTEGHENDSAIN